MKDFRQTGISRQGGRAISGWLTLALLLWGLSAGQSVRLVHAASGRADLSISAAPAVILADGKSATTLTATVRDGAGNLAADGTSVRFTTSLGTLETDAASTQSGVARVQLTSAATAGTATVKATAFVGSGGSSAGLLTVEFTSDRDALFAGPGAGWIRMDCPQYLVYSADSKIVEAQGRKGSAHLNYKSLSVVADSFQLDIQTQQLLARNATLQRGRRILQTAQLRYNLADGAGVAVVLTSPPGERHATYSSVAVKGYGLETVPLDADAAQAGVEDNLYRFADIADSKVVVSARAISVDPGNQVQFRRAAIYSDGKKVLSVPLHVMPLSTQELFGQQVLGFGSQGLVVDVPFHYHVSPGGMGTLYLRNSAVSGGGSRSVGSGRFGSSGARPGLALDLEQTYSAGRGGSGALSLTGLTRSEWGAHWNHTQRIDEETSAFLFLDSPSHRSLYGSSSLSRQFKGFSLNVSALGSKDPGFGGYSSSLTSVSAYVATTARQIGLTGINYTANFSMQTSQNSFTAPLSSSQEPLQQDRPQPPGSHLSAFPGQLQAGRTVVTPSSTRGVDLRFFTAPLHPNRRTTLTNALTVGQAWDARTGESRHTVLGTLALNRTTGGNGLLILNYNYRYDPLRSHPNALTSGSPFYSSTQQRLSLDFSAAPTDRLNFLLSGSYALSRALGGGDSSLFGAVNYRINNDWGLGLSTSMDRFAQYRYNDTRVLLSRRVLGRDVVFTYSTQTKKVHFDLGVASF